MATGSKKLFSQFNVQAIIETISSNFLALLSQTAILKRPYDSDEGVKHVNEYGEIVLTHPTAPAVNSSLSIRIDPVRGRGANGLTIKTQGGEVIATYRGFVQPTEDVRENDQILIGSREYQVLLVEDFFGARNVHHKELWMRRVDNL